MPTDPLAGLGLRPSFFRLYASWLVPRYIPDLDLPQDTPALWNFDWGGTHTCRAAQEINFKDKGNSELCTTL